jgi:hypothetical protein
MDGTSLGDHHPPHQAHPEVGRPPFLKTAWSSLLHPTSSQSHFPCSLTENSGASWAG